MGAPVYKTKGELRSILLTRLGYGGLGAAAGMFVPVADDLLDEAQEQLYELLKDDKHHRQWSFYTGVGQQYYSIPDTCDVDHIDGVWVKRDNEVWTPLERGIKPKHDSYYDDTESYPYLYDLIAVEAAIAETDIIVDGTFDIDDSTSAGSTNPGWSWTSGATWEIASGKATCLVDNKLLTSAAVPAISTRYRLEYTIGGVDAVAVAFGGIGGLPTTVGSHIVYVDTNGLISTGLSVTGLAGTTVDDVVAYKSPEGAATLKLEVWPKVDDVYEMRIEGEMQVAPFVADGDRCSFDHRLILLYAIAYGKAHLKKTDAKAAMDAWTTRLKQIKANQHGTRRYQRQNPNTHGRVVRAKPRVV